MSLLSGTFSKPKSWYYALNGIAASNAAVWGKTKMEINENGEKNAWCTK